MPFKQLNFGVDSSKDKLSSVDTPPTNPKPPVSKGKYLQVDNSGDSNNPYENRHMANAQRAQSNQQPDHKGDKTFQPNNVQFAGPDIKVNPFNIVQQADPYNKMFQNSLGSNHPVDQRVHALEDEVKALRDCV